MASCMIIKPGFQRVTDSCGQCLVKNVEGGCLLYEVQTFPTRAVVMRVKMEEVVICRADPGWGQTP